VSDGERIIIKKVKKRGGHEAHHGGAWKVAYADFVTAMMAFFMLLWLVGSTTTEQRAGISDYFQNPSAIEGVTGVSNSAIDLGGGMIATTSSDHIPDPDAPLDDMSKQLDIEAEARALEYKQLEALKQEIATNPEREPDFGPRKIGKAGATAVGAREQTARFPCSKRRAHREIGRAHV
jgi:chemotaxis protein MotB